VEIGIAQSRARACHPSRSGPLFSGMQFSSVSRPPAFWLLLRPVAGRESRPASERSGSAPLGVGARRREKLGTKSRPLNVTRGLLCRRGRGVSTTLPGEFVMEKPRRVVFGSGPRRRRGAQPAHAALEDGAPLKVTPDAKGVRGASSGGTLVKREGWHSRVRGVGTSGSSPTQPKPVANVRRGGYPLRPWESRTSPTPPWLSLTAQRKVAP
jgi:hypothetical protein